MSDFDDDDDFNFDNDVDVIIEEDEEVKLKKPNMYRVMILNDDYTPREFVVLILRQVFHKSETEGSVIMYEAHTKGIAVVGIYTLEVAKTSLFLVEKLSEEFGFPLRCIMEEVEI